MATKASYSIAVVRANLLQHVVLATSWLGALANPIWLSLICTKLNPAAGAAAAVPISRERGTPPLTVQSTPVPARAGSLACQWANAGRCIHLDNDRPFVHVMFVNTASTLPGLPQRLSQHLALILGSLRAALAAGIGREPSRVALLLLAWPYLHRVEARFASLVSRIASGRVASGRFAVATPRAGAMTLRAREPRQSLPRRFGWMVLLTPAALPLASQVRHLLSDPEFSALIAAAPQAGRILRPLCRMLGIAQGPDFPPALFAPPRASASSTALIVPPAAPATIPRSDARLQSASAASSRGSPRSPMPA